MRIRAFLSGLIVLGFAGFVFLTSCEDEFTEKDAFEQALALSNKRDSLARVQKAKEDSIARADSQRKDSIANAELKMKDSLTLNIRVSSYPSNDPLSGVSLTVVQNSTKTVVSNSEGVLSVRMLKANAELLLKEPNHATARLQYNYNVASGQAVLFATLKLPRVKDNDFFTVEGTANAEFDLTNPTLYSNVPAGVEVKASLQTNLIGIVNTLNDPAITNVTLSDLPEWNVSTTTDNNGHYVLRIPSVTGASYTYKIEFGDFTANQRLAINRFLDASEATGQHSLFGDFGLVEVPTLFTSREVLTNGYNAPTPFATIPVNVPAFKVEIVEDPTSGQKPLYTALVVSNPTESYYNGLPVGRIFQFVKATSYDNAVYSYGSTLSFRITDIRDGSVTTAQMTNPFYGSYLPSYFQLNPLYNYNYNYVVSPDRVFDAGKTTYDLIPSPTNQGYGYVNFTSANSYFAGGQSYYRTPRNINIVSVGLPYYVVGMNFDYAVQRYYASITGKGGQNVTLDFSYGTGIKSRPVE